MRLRTGNRWWQSSSSFNHWASRQAFSLVELLIVVALILIMFVMYFSPGAKRYQMQKLVECNGNLLNIYVALELYARDHDGKFPVVTNARTAEEPLTLLVPRYTARTDIFICPGSGDRKLTHAQPLERARISYAYYMGRGPKNGASAALMTDEQVSTGSKAAGATVFSADGKAPGNNHKQFGGNILFADGTIQAEKATSSVALPFPAGVTLLNPR